MENQVAKRQTDDLVTILLATYNGAVFIKHQLASFAAQSHQNWALLVSDDGSVDTTREIVETFAAQNPMRRIDCCDGPRKGFRQNFMSLVRAVQVQSRYYAFSDQDDIWEPEKLARAIAAIQDVPADVPALYCGRTRYVDENDDDLGLSPLFQRPPSFRNALVQSIGGGNTMVFNEATRQLILDAGAEADVPSHDWWIYILVTACGGKVIYDAEPFIRYRQHSQNIVGMNVGLAAKLLRVRKLFHGQLQVWNESHILALAPVAHRFTAENKKIFHIFQNARRGFAPVRLYNLLKSGVHRQSFLGNLGLFVATLFGRV